MAGPRHRPAGRSPVADRLINIDRNTVDATPPIPKVFAEICRRIGPIAFQDLRIQLRTTR